MLTGPTHFQKSTRTTYNKQSFSAASAGTSFVVPLDVPGGVIQVKLWAPGGGSGNTSNTGLAGDGGGGGYVAGNLTVVPGETLTLKIGGKGLGSVRSSGNYAGSGGGYTAILRGATILALAGGGAGGAGTDKPDNAGRGGPGGGNVGGTGSANGLATAGPGVGGSQVAGGTAGGDSGGGTSATAGSALQGGTGGLGPGQAGGTNGGGTAGGSTRAGGGGGAGKFGGGGGGHGENSPSRAGAGGGGGSNDVGSLTGSTNTQGSTWHAANNADADRIGNAGDGGVALVSTLADGVNGNDGLIVIYS